MDTGKKTRKKPTYSKATLEKRRYRARMKRAAKVFKLFQRTYSLAKTGKKLGLCRESVRAIIEFGHRTGAFTYFGKFDTQRLAELLATADRAQLARDLAALTLNELCAKYGIADSLGYKLLRYAAQGRSLAEL